MRSMAALAMAIALIIGGCVSAPAPTFTPVTYSEWEQVKNHRFENLTPTEFYDALESVLMLADGEDFEFTYNGNGMTATRSWVHFLVFAGTGTDTWTFDAIERNGGVDASARLISQYRITDQEKFSGPNGSVPVFEMLWARVDYMLGRSNHWPTCDEVEKRVENEPDPARKNLFGLCHISMKDEDPDE